MLDLLVGAPFAMPRQWDVSRSTKRTAGAPAFVTVRTAGFDEGSQSRTWSTLNKDLGGGNKSGKKESHSSSRNPSDKPAKEVAKFGADTPMKRPAQPEEIAPAFVYFASEVDSSYVTGEILTLLGGETTAG